MAIVNGFVCETNGMLGQGINLAYCCSSCREKIIKGEIDISQAPYVQFKTMSRVDWFDDECSRKGCDETATSIVIFSKQEIEV